MASEALVLDAVDSAYGDSQVLYGVSFVAHPGRVLALLGRNGAGKTTCISTIMGLLPARRGTIHLFGEPIQALTPEAISRLGIGLVPQGRRVFPHLTVAENLTVAQQKPRFGGTATWDLARVYKLFPRLSDRRGQAAGSLSGGEQQMLAISRALMSNPRLVLLDEPSEGLAPQIVLEVARTISMLKAEGLSIVLVEQNIKVALELADDCAIVNTGRVVYAGSAQGVRDDAQLVEQNLGMH
ncbi:MAG: transporter ATP-binding protein [Rhizobacter sp.]|nr:transporter ATP-binding protein [Rhizobacter sp.]